MRNTTKLKLEELALNNLKKNPNWPLVQLCSKPTH